MYPICYWQVSGGYLQPEPTMYSRCFCWFPGPLAPSVRFLAGLPTKLSQRLTLWERMDPARHQFSDFVAKLHELEEAEDVTKAVNTAVVDEQQKTGNQGRWRPDKPCVDEGCLSYRPQRGPQRVPVQQQYNHQPLGGRCEEQPAKGKRASLDVVCFWCQGKGHYVSNPTCPMFEKGGGLNRQLQDWPQLKAT